jgi:hypothetical protein
MTPPHSTRTANRWWWVAGLAIAAAVVILLGPLASGDPDGLQRVAIDQGFAARESAAPFEIIPGYAVPFLDGPASKIAAGLIGVLVVFTVLWVVGRLLARRSRSPRP